MPQFTPIVLADGEATPVSHTFDMRSMSGGRLVAVNRAAPTLETQEILSVEVKQAASAKSPSKVRITLGLPKAVTDASTSVIGVGHLSSFTGEFVFAPTSTEQERKNLRTLVKNALLDSKVLEAIDEVEPFFG